MWIIDYIHVGLVVSFFRVHAIHILISSFPFISNHRKSIEIYA
jgi:hypothetical protein